MDSFPGQLVPEIARGRPHGGGDSQRHPEPRLAAGARASSGATTSTGSCATSTLRSTPSTPTTPTPRAAGPRRVVRALRTGQGQRPSPPAIARKPHRRRVAADVVRPHRDPGGRRRRTARTPSTSAKPPMLPREEGHPAPAPPRRFRRMAPGRRVHGPGDPVAQRVAVALALRGRRARVSTSSAAVSTSSCRRGRGGAEGREWIQRLGREPGQCRTGGAGRRRASDLRTR